MGFEVVNVADRVSPIRALIYGHPGCGKTTLASGAPNPIYLDYENSTEVLKKTGINVSTLGNSTKDLRDFGKVIKWIENDAPKSGFETIVVDTVSSMNHVFLHEHMIQATKGGSKRDLHMALFADFRKNKNQMVDLYFTLAESPLNVVILSHSKEITDETGKVLEIRPDLPPATQKAIEQLTNELFYMTRTVKPASMGGQTQRKIVVNAEGKILAKNRQGLTQSEYEDPTWDTLYPSN